MSMLTELFGDEIFLASLGELKEKIKKLPRVQKERYAYLLKEYAHVKGINLTKKDFEDIVDIETKND